MLKLKFICRQVVIMAIIAAIANVYAFEYWCNARLSNHTVHAAGHHEHATGHAHGSHHGSQSGKSSPEHHEHPEPGHHASGETDNGCCKEETTSFFSALHTPVAPSFQFTPIYFVALLPLWLESFLAAILGNAHLLAGYFPDVGLPPKVPDIRLYICSLTI